MTLIIKQVETDQLLSAMQLIEEVFLKYVAPDYSQKGIDTFLKEFIQNKNFHDRFSNGKEKMLGAYVNDELAGVLSISSNNTISCVFIREQYQRMGIATKLFYGIMKSLDQTELREIKLNASSYGIPFYESLGFHKVDEQKDYNGICYTPMTFALNKKEEKKG